MDLSEPIEAIETPPAALDRPTTAAHRVLHLPELLEIILQNLPQRQLLLCQRTSRNFRSTVTTSPRLQKSLFLLPDLKPPPPPFSFAANSPQSLYRPGLKPENNRLLLHAFPGGEYPTVHLHIEYKPSSSDLDLGRRGAEFYSWDVNISFPALGPEELPGCCSPAARYPEASWRRMYLCQPPVRSLHLARRHIRSSNAAIVREGGITMGDFVHEATKVQEHWHQSYISSDGDRHFEGNIQCSQVEE